MAAARGSCAASIAGDAILGDLAEEHHAERRARGRFGAGLWYWREAAGVAGRLAVARHRARRPAPSPFPIPGDSFMSGLWRDLRLAARLLAHQRAFAGIIILTLAVGLAANATVIALIDGLVLRPFPLRDIDRLIQVYGAGPGTGLLANRSEISPADFVDFQRESRTADLVALEWWDATVAGQSEPERLQGFRVSPAFFDALGVGVAAGRGFSADEGQVGRNRVAVISDALWHRRFAADPAIIGRTVNIEASRTRSSASRRRSSTTRTAATCGRRSRSPPMQLERRQSRYLSVIGRLRDGASAARVQAEVAATAARLAQQYPATNRGWGVNVMPLAESVVDLGAHGFLGVQQIATLLVLLLACANVANLLIVRAADRSKELALRVALGASRWRVIRLLAIESLALAIAGAAGAIPLTWAALQACRAAMPPTVARFVRGWDEVDLDLRVVVALAALAVVSTIFFGLLPALRASRVSLNDALKTGGRSSDSGKHRLRNAMVVVEVALALTLLVAAGLSVRGTMTVLFRDDGYDPEGVMTMRISLIGSQYETPEAQRAFFERLREDARGAIGLDGVALANVAPGSPRNQSNGVDIEGHPVTDAAQRRSADIRRATPGFLETLRIRLLSGRDFTAADGPDALPVALVSETMARRYWSGEDPDRPALPHRRRRDLAHRRRRRPRRPPQLVLPGHDADVLPAVRPVAGVGHGADAPRARRSGTTGRRRAPAGVAAGRRAAGLRGALAARGAFRKCGRPAARRGLHGRVRPRRAAPRRRRHLRDHGLRRATADARDRRPARTRRTAARGAGDDARPRPAPDRAWAWSSAWPVPTRSPR